MNVMLDQTTGPVPRTRGDEPAEGFEGDDLIARSPHTRVMNRRFWRALNGRVPVPRHTRG